MPNKLFIFDEVYRNALEKEKIGSSDQFSYYKTLNKIRDKFRRKNRGIEESVFEKSDFPKPASREPMLLTSSSLFDVEKVNNKMFKIHKSAVYSDVESKPSSLSARTHGRSSRHLEFEISAKHVIDI